MKRILRTIAPRAIQRMLSETIRKADSYRKNEIESELPKVCLAEKHLANWS